MKLHTDDTTGALVLRSADRFLTQTPWLESRHCFSFGEHYDPDNIGYGHLIVSNDDIVAAGGGFDRHRHADAEIVTWVLSGTLLHTDSLGSSGEIHRGLAQRMSAGRGVVHSESNADTEPGGTPVRFVQMWIRPQESGLEPSYEQTDVTKKLASEDWVIVASGMPHHHDVAAVRIHQPEAALWVAHAGRGRRLRLPAAPRIHVYVARGEVALETGITLADGDSMRTSGGDQFCCVVSEAAEVLVWQLGDVASR